VFDETKITGVVVSYNTQSLLQRSLESIRKFYPKMPIIIVDGSTKDDPCSCYVKGIKNKNTKCYCVDYNIGHGNGMHFAIEKIETPYVLIFDSDIKVKKPVLHLMFEKMNSEVYGVGCFENLQKCGYFRREDVGGISIPYLHPWFTLLNREMYYKFPKFCHHGSPCINTMNEIYNQNLSEKILIPLNVHDYVIHYGQGTRKIRPKEFLSNQWDYVPEFLSIVCRRHPKRPTYYKQHIQSLLSQSCKRFHHIALCDLKGKGVPFANKMLYTEMKRITGNYVFILDDDNILNNNSFVADIKEIVEEHAPDVIMIKGIRNNKVYPTDTVWKNKPQFAHIDMANFIVTKEVYQRHAQKFCINRGADYNFIADVFKQKYKIFWQDKIYSSALSVSFGKEEVNYKEEIVVPVPKIEISSSFPVTAITCTGDRPEAFELCKTWLQRQTIPVKQWIIIDDGEVPLKEIPADSTYIRREAKPTDPKHTLCLNLLEGLEVINQPNICIFEDDDWYHPTYIETMMKWLQSYDMVGVGSLVFYSLRFPGFNYRHKSKQPALYQTVFNQNVVPFMKNLCQSVYQIPGLAEKGLLDSQIWTQTGTVLDRDCVIVTIPFDSPMGPLKKGMTFFKPFPPFIERRIGTQRLNFGKKPIKKFIYDPEQPIAIGIKNMPGRCGLTQAQKSGLKFYTYDTDCTYLKKLIKDDIKYYEEFIRYEGTAN
jgi:hypothetical protein